MKNSSKKSPSYYPRPKKPSKLAALSGRGDGDNRPNAGVAYEESGSKKSPFYPRKKIA